MRISRVYCNASLTTGGSVQLEDEAAHYLLKVLRLKAHATVNLFNERDGEFSGQLVAAERRKAVIALDSPVVRSSDSALPLHLGLGLSRGERMDYSVQKATELGAHSITPLLTEYCEVKLDSRRQQNRVEHWQRVAISACEQCGRTKPPVIHAPVALPEWMENLVPGPRLVFDHSGGNLPELSRPEAVNLLVGPEGGLSDEEIGLAVETGFVGVKLGPRILRTETAPVAALAILQFLYGDLQGK